ncbi:MAG: sulfite exporter TauE/SafE family protein [Bacteroidia bacterium]|nr:sulfite exporter TauE/SafE family protein [Bacteroidia bacterium]
MNLDVYSVLLLLIIGALAGTVSAFLGIGGGLVIIPLLVSLLNYSQKSAQGTSLALMLPPIGILAVMNYYKNGNVNITHAIIMSVGFIIASYFASLIAIKIDDHLLKKIFAVFLILYAIKLLLGK